MMLNTPKEAKKIPRAAKGMQPSGGRLRITRLARWQVKQRRCRGYTSGKLELVLVTSPVPPTLPPVCASTWL